MVQYSITPWASRADLFSIRRALYPDGASTYTYSPAFTLEQWAATQRALSLITLYSSRGNCPHLLSSTGLLINAIFSELFAPSTTPQSTPGVHSSPDIVRLSYSMAFSRFITGTMDGYQTKAHKMSMYGIAKSIGLKASWVELRHACTHEEMPSVGRLRSVVREALGWIYTAYWEPLGEDKYLEAKKEKFRKKMMEEFTKAQDMEIRKMEMENGEREPASDDEQFLKEYENYRVKNIEDHDLETVAQLYMDQLSMKYPEYEHKAMWKRFTKEGLEKVVKAFEDNKEWRKYELRATRVLGYLRAFGFTDDSMDELFDANGGPRKKAWLDKPNPKPAAETTKQYSVARSPENKFCGGYCDEPVAYHDFTWLMWHYIDDIGDSLEEVYPMLWKHLQKRNKQEVIEAIESARTLSGKDIALERGTELLKQVRKHGVGKYSFPGIYNSVGRGPLLEKWRDVVWPPPARVKRKAGDMDEFGDKRQKTSEPFQPDDEGGEGGWKVWEGPWVPKPIGIV